MTPCEAGLRLRLLRLKMSMYQQTAGGVNPTGTKTYTIYTASSSAPMTILRQHRGVSGYFVKKFLLNDKMNRKGWRVPWNTIKQYSASLKGMPEVYDPVTEDHPATDVQEAYRIGTVREVLPPDETAHTLWGIVEITDGRAQRMIESGELRHSSVSVAVDTSRITTHADGTETLHWYRGNHDAMVRSPAYGPAARIKASCRGAVDACRTALRTASGPSDIDALRLRTAVLRLRLASLNSDRAPSTSCPAPCPAPVPS